MTEHLDVERLAQAYTRVRGAHNSGDQYGEGPPCDWCRLAAEQHIEAVAEYARLGEQRRTRKGERR